MREKTPMPSSVKCYDRLDPKSKETDLSSSGEDRLLSQKTLVRLGSNQVNMVVET
jgi:hypothetical protein